MKAHELMLICADEMGALAEEAKPAEDARRQEAYRYLRERVSNIFMRAEVAGYEIDEDSIPERHVPENELGVHVVRRVLEAVFDADDDIQERVGERGIFAKQVVIIGIHDVTQTYRGEATTVAAASCDIITSFRGMSSRGSDYGYEVDSFLDGVVVLERTNHYHPVFDYRENGHVRLPGDDLLDEEVIFAMKHRNRERDWELIFGGMHVALDDIEYGLSLPPGVETVKLQCC